nr:hypothetical protein [Rhodopseudomonas rhenobacensis]
MVKDPTTGKRISRINPKEQHRITEAPQLRIIDDVTWNAAQAIKLKRSHLGATHPAHHGVRFRACCDVDPAAAE